MPKRIFRVRRDGHLIDEQYADTMLEAGISFLASQFLLAFFIWKFSSPKPGDKVKTFPGGATGMVVAAVLLVGTEALALGVFGTKAWASVYFTPPAANALPIQVQAGQFAFYFRYPGPDRARNVVFGGKDLQTLYITAGSRVWKRHLRRKGVFPWLPVKLPRPQL